MQGFGFDSDKLKKFAAKAGAATTHLASVAGQYATEASKVAAAYANEAGKAATTAAAHAQQVAEKAASDARRTATAAMTASPAAALIGAEITISGRHLVVESLVAEGGFGSVYLATVVGTEEKLILKKMFANGPDVVQQLTSEVKLMESMSHPNIVRVLGSEVKQRGRESVEILLLLEWCPGGHMLARLNSLKDSGRKLTSMKILEVYLQMVTPVAYMHSLSPPVAHRDLKFENVLISQDGTLRLCDFGSASSHSGPIADKADRVVQEDAILRFTTPHFRSPEMCDLYNGQPLDVRSDVWALGCMLYGIAYFSHPFQETGTLAILSARYKLPTQPAFAAPIHTIIMACLQYAPADRPTAQQLVEYIQACIKAGEAGPFPPLQLSGGGSVQSAAIKTPAPGAEGALPDGSIMITASKSASRASGSRSSFGNAEELESGSSTAPRKAGGKTHAPTAQEIAAQALTAAAASGGPKSGALAARLAKKPGAPAPLGGLMAPTVPAAPAPAPAPAPAARAAAPAAADFDSFDAFSSGAASAPAAAAPSVHSSAASSDFDAFDAIGFGSAAPAPAAQHSRARAPSGDAVASTTAPSAPSAGAGDFDFFGSEGAGGAAASATAATPLDDPFASMSVSSGAPATKASAEKSPFDFF